MSSVQTLSTAILHLLADFGEEKLRMALQGPEDGAERQEILSMLDNEIYSFRPQFEITEKRPVSLECDVVKFQNKKEIPDRF